MGGDFFLGGRSVAITKLGRGKIEQALGGRFSSGFIRQDFGHKTLGTSRTRRAKRGHASSKRERAILYLPFISFGFERNGRRLVEAFVRR